MLRALCENTGSVWPLFQVRTTACGRGDPPTQNSGCFAPEYSSEKGRSACAMGDGSGSCAQVRSGMHYNPAQPIAKGDVMNAFLHVVKTGLVLAGLVFSGTLFAAGSETAPVESPRLPELVAGKEAIEAKDWKRAIDNLRLAAAKEPANADIQNYLGYANRKSGNLDAAFKYYDEALKLDPKHRGAHEYIGEAYLMAGNLAKAEVHLAALDKLCVFSCEEYRDLKKAIAEYKAKK
jgi:hypothetical protein